jgi:hypothetical protein
MIRSSLRHPESSRTFLESAVPTLAAGFDCTRAHCLDREFPLDDWRLHEADLPFEISFRHDAEELLALVCVLIEHQSDTDPLLPLRLLYFAVEYWDRQWRAWEQLKAPRPRLRPILPLVLYTGPTVWGSNRALADLLGEPAVFHAFAPSWQPLFWNLADRTPEALLASGKEWLQTLAVVRAQPRDTAAFEAVFKETLGRLQNLYGRDHGRWYDLLRVMLTWALYRRAPHERKTLLAAAKASQAEVRLQQEVQLMGQTIAEALIEEGIAKGEAKGELRALRRSLRRLLEKQFGTLPEALVRRISELTDLECLDQAIVETPGLKSLDELHLEGA